MMRHAGLVLAASGALLIAGCERDAAPPPPPNQPAAKAAARPSEDVAKMYEGVTPNADRVAVLGLLNKRNGFVTELTLKPGEARQVGRAVVRLRSCERTAQWENPQETGAFVQLDVLKAGERQWRRVFSGWLFKDRPERNVVQHPIYDVFVKSCAMEWPGEVEVPGADERTGLIEAPSESDATGTSGSPASSNGAPAASQRSSAPQSPTRPTPAARPSAAPRSAEPKAPPSPPPAPKAAPAPKATPARETTPATEG